MKSMSIVLAFVAIFAGCAYIEHKEIEARLDADSERAANARELAADYGDSVEVIYAQRAVNMAINQLEK